MHHKASVRALAEVSREPLRQSRPDRYVPRGMKTVLSGPVGNKLRYIAEEMRRGYFANGITNLGVAYESPR